MRPPAGSRPALAGLLIGLVLGLAGGLLLGRLTGASHVMAAPPTTPLVVDANGASRVESGVPVGYAPTQAGAVAAVTNYSRVLGGPLELQPQALRAAVQTMATEDYSAQLLADLDQDLVQLQNRFQLLTNHSRGVAVAIRAVPVAYQVEAWAGSTARVSVWEVSILAEDQVLAPQEIWVTNRVSVAWQANDWKVTGWGGEAGPQPAAPAAGHAPVALPAQLRDWQEYAHVGA